MAEWGSESQFQNAAYVLQGLAYPFTAFSPLFKRISGLDNDVVAIAVLGAAFVTVWLLAAWRGGGASLRLALFGVLWFVLAVVPAALLLDFNYMIESPRLMYLASVGASLFLAAPFALEPIAPGARWHGDVRRVAALLVALGLCIPALTYLDRRAVLYRDMANAIAGLDVAHTTAQTVCAPTGPAPTTTLAVNFPEWYFVQPTDTSLGHDGLKTIAERRGLTELYLVNHPSSNARFDAVMLPDIQTTNQPYKSLGESQTYESIAARVRDSSSVVLTRWSEGASQTLLVGCRMPASVPDDAVVTFDGRQALVAVNATVVDAGRSIQIDLDWQAIGPATDDVTVFAQLLDENGRVVAQADGYPVGGVLPMRLWQIGDRWRIFADCR